MEPDRYATNKRLYFMGIICLVISMGLVLFSLYIIPYLVFNIHYDIPEFMAHFINYFQEKHDFSEGMSKVLVWLCFFIPGVLCGLVSNYASNCIDNDIFKSDLNISEETEVVSSPETRKKMMESAAIGSKIFLLMILFVGLILLLEQLIRLL